MEEDKVVEFRNPASVVDSLSELLRSGAKRLLAQAVEAEVSAYLAERGGLKDAAGRAVIVRNGYLPEREVLTGVGPVAVRIPKVRSRSGERAVFHSALVPPYVRKAKRVEAALPWL